MNTAEQINTPQVGSVKLSADALRSKMVEQYEQFKPALDRYYDYAQRASALAIEYHAARLQEYFGLVPEELTLLKTLDARETPATLDRILAEIKNKHVRRITFDRASSTYFLFV